MGFEVAAGLAAVVVRVVLPYVKQGAEKMAGALADRAADAAAEGGSQLAARLWNRVRAALTASGDEDVVAQVEKRPEASAPLLEEVLRERIAQDPQLADDLRALVDQSVAAGEDVIQIFGTGGVAKAGDVSGGIVAGYIGSVDRPESPPPTSGSGSSGSASSGSGA
jgi:hypothetical protein